jgi:hypothetical protein
MASISEAIRAALPPEHQDGHPAIFMVYALLARVKGLETTAADVHDAWAAWKAITGADHDALVPFDELSEEVQEKDDPFVRAIHEVARSL